MAGDTGQTGDTGSTGDTGPLAGVRILESPDLVARRFFTRHDHPEFGVRPLAGVPWTTDLSDMRIDGPAPMLGQHTEEVLGKVLGLSSPEVHELRETGVAR